MGERHGDNDCDMSRPGSGEADRPFHPAQAAVLVALGILAMLRVTALLVGPLGLGLRATVAVGTLMLGAPAALALPLAPLARRAVLGRPLTARSAGICLLLGATLWVGSVGVITVQALFRPPTAEELEVFRRLHAALAPANPLDAVVSVAVIALLPALAEELVMRGVLLTSLAVRLGAVLSVVVTAALFAVIHDPLRLLFAFVLGLVFGLVRLRTGSLWPSVVVHATLNTLTFLIAPLVDDPSQPYTPEPLLGACCLLAGIAGSWPLVRALRRPLAVSPPETAA